MSGDLSCQTNAQPGHRKYKTWHCVISLSVHHSFMKWRKDVHKLQNSQLSKIFRFLIIFLLTQFGGMALCRDPAATYMQNKVMFSVHLPKINCASMVLQFFSTLLMKLFLENVNNQLWHSWFSEMGRTDLKVLNHVIYHIWLWKQIAPLVSQKNHLL